MKSRVARYTYGIEIASKNFAFDQRFSGGEVVPDKDGYVYKIFHVFVTRDTRLPSNYEVTQKNFAPMTPSQTTSWLRLYRTESYNPKFVSDPGCVLIGTISIPVNMQREFSDRKFDVKLMFGDTEIKVSAWDKDGQHVEGNFAFAE
jgi:hypothetical protein